MTNEYSWIPVFALPNIGFKESIGNDVIAMSSIDDPRIAELKRDKIFAKYLNSFTDQFGVRYKPTILLVKNGADPKLLGPEAIAGFRDLIALSVILYGRTRSLKDQNSSLKIIWGENFSYHPWALGKDFQYILSIMPSGTSLHETNKFRGQTH